MPIGSRRYFTTTLPVEHINGKMAPSSVKCKNTHNLDGEHESYYYGYRRLVKSVNRYAIRSIPRDLNTKPYTAHELQSRALFVNSIAAVHAYRREPIPWGLCLEEYRKQDIYQTPIGFAIATCRKNGGEWPERWTT